ncbi:MAG: SDR family NAD(P)-dependent oxidoreductase [Anaerolineae bacterium]|nr:SDR family NAD(P)-dependent oxidoreductase [Anaerolineae bacterium]
MSRVWFITGSSRGLGRAIAEIVLAQGDKLVATARRPEQLNALKEQYGDQIRTVALDVRHADQAQAAIQTAVDVFGQLDVVVNNAGYGNIAAIEEASAEEFRDQIDTNLWGVIHVTRAALPFLRRQRSGHIIQISSVGGRIGTAGLSAYQTAKWGVEGFSEVLAQEVAPLGIKVTIVEPGAMATDWAGSSMHITEPGDDYQASVGMVVSMLRSVESVSTYGSDIHKVAQAILTIVDTPEPPLRLLMGSDAWQLAMAADQKKLAEMKQWQDLSYATDVDAADLSLAEEVTKITNRKEAQAS